MHQSVVTRQTLQSDIKRWCGTNYIIKHIEHARSNQFGDMQSKAIIVSPECSHVPQGVFHLERNPSIDITKQGEVESGTAGKLGRLYPFSLRAFENYCGNTS